MKSLEDAYAMDRAETFSDRILGRRGASKVFAALLEHMPATFETLYESVGGVLSRQGLRCFLSDLDKYGIVERRYRLKDLTGRLLGEAAYQVGKHTENAVAADLAFRVKASEIIDLLTEINKEWVGAVKEEPSEEAAQRRILKWLKERVEAETKQSG